MDTYMWIHIWKHRCDMYTHHIYGCIYVYTYMDIYGYIYIYGYEHPQKNLCIHVYIYMDTHMCKHASMYICIHIYVNMHKGWQRCTGCLIFVGHLSQKSPIISGSFAERSLQLKAPYGSSPPCTHLLTHKIRTGPKTLGWPCITRHKNCVSICVYVETYV